MLGQDTMPTGTSDIEAWCSAVLTASLDGIVIIDQLGRILSWNASAERIFGYASHEVAGKAIDDLILPERYQKVGKKWISRHLDKLKKATINKSFKISALKADHTEFPLEFTVSSMRQELGLVFIVMLRDITERKQLEKAKEEAEMRLQREGLVRRLVEMINQSLDMQTILETAAREVGEFLQADRALVIRYNYDAEAEKLKVLFTSQYCANEATLPFAEEDVESVFKSFQHLTPQLFEEHVVTTGVKGSLAETMANYEALLSKLNITDISLAHLKSLELKYSTLSTIRGPIFYNGIPYGSISVDQCSYRREWSTDEVDLLKYVADQLGIALAQAELYQAEQLARREEAQARNEAEEANRKKSEFLAMMSHELRTPLNSIIGYSRMIEKGMVGPLTDLQSTYIQNVGFSGRHLLNIVNDLLDVSQMEAGNLMLSPQDFAVRPILDEVRAIMHVVADKQQVDLVFDIQPEIEMLHADPARFKQILINLLSNAIKFNHPQGYARLRLFKSEDQQWIIGEIQDNGMGIARDKQADLFKKFYQVDAAIARTHEGTGLGLALTKELVEHHGGQVSVISEKGIGSTFTFCLPVRSI